MDIDHSHYVFADDSVTAATNSKHWGMHVHNYPYDGLTLIQRGGAYYVGEEKDNHKHEE